jgi:hypothetical protein
MDLSGVGVKVWAGFIWFRIGKMADCCEHGNELPGSIKRGIY